MKALTATSPGHPGRSNEGFRRCVAGGRGAARRRRRPGDGVDLRHGVAWYAHTLGAALLASLTRGGGATDPVSALAEAIDQIAARHRHTCDIANPSSPQATVAIVTVEDGWLGYLVLADALVVLDPADATPVVIIDPREVALLSNGASRIVDPYRLADWPTVLARLRTSGPDELMQRLRRAEARARGTGSLPGFQEPDDAMMAYGDLTPGASWFPRSAGSQMTDGG